VHRKKKKRPLKNTRRRHLQVMERGFRGHQTCQHFYLGVVASKIMRKSVSFVEATQSVVFDGGSPRKLAQHYIWTSSHTGPELKTLPFSDS
jgi:hypothetical protein